MGVSDTIENVLLSADVWERIEGEGLPAGDGYVLGLDLGQNAAMSAAAAYWPDTGGLEAVACFPETPDLATRGQSDGVDRLYVACAERGELFQAGATGVGHWRTSQRMSAKVGGAICHCVRSMARGGAAADA